jgi:hypothetical protein
MEVFRLDVPAEPCSNVPPVEGRLADWPAYPKALPKVADRQQSGLDSLKKVSTLRGPQVVRLGPGVVLTTDRSLTSEQLGML